jgi:hypothetical protein
MASDETQDLSFSVNIARSSPDGPSLSNGILTAHVVQKDYNRRVFPRSRADIYEVEIIILYHSLIRVVVHSV